MKKIVDVVAIVKKDKNDKNSEYIPAPPLRYGKLEEWWYGSGNGKHSVNKKTLNRRSSGRQTTGEELPSVEETLKKFNFRGFEFGNWLSQADRYDVFRAFQYCLIDMAKWLNTFNIGFDNQIGVAFGARGSRGASAHFEAGSNIINMTKKQGAGGLLHEYAHAIDYSIGAFIDQTANFTSLSGGHTLSQSEKNVGCQFRAMINQILLYVRSTDSYKRMCEIPKRKANIDYWGNSTELFARLTEAYYAYFYNETNNHYLVDPKSEYEGKNKEDGTYLSKAEINVIKPEIDKFWKEVGLLLNNKCTLKATPFPVDAIKPKADGGIYHITASITDEENYRWEGVPISKGEKAIYYYAKDFSKEEALKTLAKIMTYDLKASKVVKKAKLDGEKLTAEFQTRYTPSSPSIKCSITWTIEKGSIKDLKPEYASKTFFPAWVLESHKWDWTKDKFMKLAKNTGSHFEKESKKAKNASSKINFHLDGETPKASNYIASHLTDEVANKILTSLQKFAENQGLNNRRSQTKYGDTLYVTVDGVKILFYYKESANGKRLNEPKADSSKKKVEKRPDKLSFDFGKFVADKTDPRDALKLTYEQYDYRVACNMFELVIEYLENELPEGYVRQYDKKNNLVYEGRLEKSPVCQAIYPNVNLALRVDPTKTAKLDIKQLTNSIEDLKKISKENKAKLKQFPKNAYVKSNEHQKAYNKSQWYDQAFFVIGGVCFRAKTISLMLYVCKMWNLNTLHIENERSGCIIKNEDESKIALFMPAPRYRNLIDEEEKMLKQKGYYVGVDYLTDHL